MDYYCCHWMPVFKSSCYPLQLEWLKYLVIKYNNGVQPSLALPQDISLTANLMFNELHSTPYLLGLAELITI